MFDLDFGGREVVRFLLSPAVRISGSLLERRVLFAWDGCEEGTAMISLAGGDKRWYSWVREGRWWFE